MKRTFSLLLALALCLPALAQSNGWLQSVQTSPASVLVGSWRSGNFMYTFNADGTYVYVGAIEGPALSTRSSETGNYSISGNNLIIARKRGLITATNGYRQDMKAETITYPLVMGRSPNGPAIQLTYPTGNTIFYRVAN